MDVTNEIIVLNYSAGVLSYSVGLQKGVTTNPNLALWEDLDEEKLLFVHSTSWRFIDNELIITWLALPKEHCVLDRIYVESPIVRSESATRPGGVHVSKQNVVAHGLRHLALLVTEDTVVRAALPADFAAYLGTLVPAAASGF
jgi:hypothetical protein